MNYTKIKCQTALHSLKRKLPYGIDLNIYRGCEHSCQYCFAMYSHKYMQSNDYFKEIFIKENIVSQLDYELSKRKKKEIINIGGVCDSYQPIEEKEQLMPSILKVMIKHKNPIIISTKSALLLRDIQLINELSQHCVVNIAATITLQEESLRKIIEPNASSSEDRFEMLGRIKKETNAVVGVHIMPIMPDINDSLKNLEYLYQRATEIGADYVLVGTLYLRGKTKPVFMSMIAKSFPHLLPLYTQMYANSYDRKPYKKGLYKKIAYLEKKYHIDSNYSAFIHNDEKTENKQLSLF